MTMHRWVTAVVLVALLGGACSSSRHKLKATAGKSTSSSSSTTLTPSPVAAANSTTSSATPTSAPVSSATSPAATNAPAPRPANIPATTPSGPPPPASTGRGAIAGHVYASCANGQPSGSGCRSQAVAGGETVQAKQGAVVVASTVTAADGTYRVDVPAGTYDVVVVRTGQTRHVVVNAGQTVVVDFTEA